MPDFLADSRDWLQEQRDAGLSREITYSRGDLSATMLSKPARSFYEVADNSVGFVKTEVRDEIIGVGEMVLDGDPIRPKVGDRITDGDYVYEVAPPATNVNEWEWTSAHRTSYRIHTKVISGPPFSS